MQRVRGFYYVTARKFPVFVTRQKNSGKTLTTSTSTSSTMSKDTPIIMKSQPFRPFSNFNKDPWRETGVEENEDDCSCSTDAVTVKVSNVVSLLRPSVARLCFVSSCFFRFSSFHSSLPDSLCRLLTSFLSLLAYHGRCYGPTNAR